MWSERPNMKSMLHSLPRFYEETPAAGSPTLIFVRIFTSFKIEVLKFTSGIIYQFKLLKNSTPFMTYRVSAILATARKLAVIIWNMVVKKVPYIPQTEYLFLDQKRKKIAAMKNLLLGLIYQLMTLICNCESDDYRTLVIIC